MSQSANSGRGLGGEAATASSTSLLERVKARDGEAWSKLCRLYGPLVYRWAREAGLQEQDAADIGQEVFGTVEARIATFRHDRPGDRFRGWLWTITRHKLGDHFRCRAAQPAAAGGTDAYERLQLLLESPAEFASRRPHRTAESILKRVCFTARWTSSATSLNRPRGRPSGGRRSAASRRQKSPPIWA
jgi:DNA-directed RNA polymerase specialized sigma24 family protein